MGKSGGLLIYVNSNILSIVLKIPDYLSNIQVIPVEIILKKQKWLVIATYTPPSQSKNYFILPFYINYFLFYIKYFILTKTLDKYGETGENTVILGINCFILTKILDKCGKSDENTVILGDFNMQPKNQILETFLEDNSFYNLIRYNTRFKSKPGSCIDLILTNNPKSFQNPGVMETSISQHDALTFSFLKTAFTKMPPNKLQYRNYKKF